MALSNLTVNYEKQRLQDRKGDKVPLINKKLDVVAITIHFKSDKRCLTTKPCSTVVDYLAQPTERQNSDLFFGTGGIYGT